MGVQPAPPKHFTLRRKPKSAALRAELFQKGRVHISTSAQHYIKIKYCTITYETCFTVSFKIEFC